MIIEGDSSPEFLEKMKAIKMSRMTIENMTTEDLIAEMQRQLDCKIWIDSTGEWHFKPNKTEQ